RLSDPAIYAAHPEFLKQSNHRERFHWRWDTPEKYQQNMRAYFRMLTGIDHVMDRPRHGEPPSPIYIFSKNRRLGFTLRTPSS
ncbi:MAG: hypothetical protein VX969_06050, partial [Verrucomicrobiota bacterium]|nr:hypothetical protein [Verrucomicrobiota bacterium]